MENRDKTLSDKTKRDYDKDPIILKYYGSFFSTMSYASSIMIAICLFYLLYEFEKNKISEKYTAFILVSIALFIVIVSNFLKYYLVCIKNKHSVVFKNLTIEYYQNEKLKNTFNLEKITPLYKPFFNEYLGKKIDIFTLLWFALYILMVFKDFIFILFPFVLFFSAIIYKISCHFLINKTFKNFSIFSSIYIGIDDFFNISYKKLYAFELEYELICNLSKNEYKDLRKYFLEKRHIDINFIDKRFV